MASNQISRSRGKYANGRFHGVECRAVPQMCLESIVALLAPGDDISSRCMGCMQSYMHIGQEDHYRSAEKIKAT